MKQKENKKEKLSPWIPGIVDTLLGARLIKESPIPHRNRLAVILLDSAFETTCRTFLKYKAKIKITEAHKHRESLIKTVKSKIADIDDVVWDIIDFNYNEIRCDFYHESAAKTITDEAFFDYQEAVEFVIDRMLDVRSDYMTKSKALTLSKEEPEFITGIEKNLPQLHSVNDKISKLLIAVTSLSPRGVEEVNEFFKKAGESLRLTKTEFTNIMARNSGTKKFFYYNKDLKVWELSGLGEFKLGEIKGGELK